MARLRFATIMLVVWVAAVAISFELGRQIRSVEISARDVSHAQATLALTHYASYEKINDFLERQCYDAAKTTAGEMRNLQITLLSDNLKRSNNDPALLEYIGFRNQELLKTIQEAHTPELHPHTTTCP